MINTENIDRLCNAAIESFELTTKQLNELGFNSKNLKVLIQDGILERQKRGLYSFKSFDKLYSYGLNLITSNDYEKANLCLMKCLELNPNCQDIYYQLLLIAIEKDDYPRAFEICQDLIDSIDKSQLFDVNYFLYLLNAIKKAPDELREYIKSIKYDNIKILANNPKYKNVSDQNNIRFLASQKKFSRALRVQYNILSKNSKIFAEDIIAKKLLFKATEIENKRRNTIFELIKAKKYPELIEYLLKKQEECGLSLYEEYSLKIAEKIVIIQNTSQIPRVRDNNKEYNNVFEAIEDCDYYAALNISNEYSKANNIKSADSLHTLLIDICSLINILSSNQFLSKKTNPVFVEVPSDIRQTITEFLQQKNWSQAFANVREYLKKFGKEDYVFLIVGLTKISLLENDNNFTKPLRVLATITNSHGIDMYNYVQEFYLMLSHNKFSEAKVYLDIIQKGNQLALRYINTDILSKALVMSETLATGHQLTQTSLSSNYSTNQTGGKVQEKIHDEKMSDFGKRFIANNYYQIVKDGILLMNPVSKEKEQDIFNALKDYSDIFAFTIGSSPKRIVLKYNPPTYGYVNIKNLFNLGNSAYSSGKYHECIDNYLQLLKFFNEPRANIYAKLGLAFMKIMNLELAIDYLTISTELSPKEDKRFDFTNLISQLKGEVSKSDDKPLFKMKQSDFNGDNDNYYGIKNFPEINSYIEESGLDVENACMAMRMYSEQIDIVKLIYAREYYRQGNFERGDLFLKSYEKSKFKTDYTMKIFEEIGKNKRFYQNRSNKEPVQLLQLTPSSSN